MSDRDADNMLPTASWFHSADRSLLRFYGGHTEGKFQCPAGIAGRNISISEGHARDRSKILAEADFLSKDGIHYQITDLGMEYVNGNIDQDELEALNPDDD